ncbi:MAG TPA: HEAT repeat domain-containing protein [Methanocella sp.]|uniref:HEAT repeat domain-containing protein n=1 Tax=Methanocella sp. TaxID=2052833 RepID=UPI002C777772|nr:HEAT repeat domain-containing protein [Methanocella sp.]HTY90546.1 HEAT repeat domain-containing protein [Methanocella sp.]
MAIKGFGRPDVEKLKEKGDVEGLIDALNYKKDSTVRSEAALAMGDIFDGRVVVALGRALDDEDSRVRLDVVHALGRVKDPRSMDVLSAALNDPDPGIRALAKKMLISHVHSLKVEPDIDGLIKAAYSIDDSIRLNAVAALGEVGDERASAVLVAICLNDIYYPVRFEAAESLKRTGDRRSAGLLSDALRDKDPAVRLHAAEALGKLGDRRAMGALSAALEDGDEAVRKEALASLSRIGDPGVMNTIVAAMKRKML